MVIRRTWLGSLRLRFVLLFVFLGIVPLLAATAFVGRHAYEHLEEQGLMLQQEVAAGFADQLRSVVEGREQELVGLDRVLGLATAEVNDQQALLANLLASQRMYQDLALLDSTGEERLKVARDGVVLQSDLRNRAEDEAFVTPVRDQTTYFGPVAFDDDAREPLMTMSYPLLDRRTGNISSVLVATVRFKPIWDLLSELDSPDGQVVFLVNEEGQVVAHPDPTVVLTGASYALPESDGRATGLAGGDTVTATADVTLGEQRILVVAEQPTSSAFVVAGDAFRVTMAVIAVTLVVALGLAFVGVRVFVRPIEKLAGSARRVADGHLSERVPVRAGNEIGLLAEAFNDMTGRLKNVFDTLELRVAERTSELEEATARQQVLISELESKNQQMARVQEQLEQLMRSKDEFLGAVSHELRTPLSSVLGFASVLRDGYATLDESERKEFVAKIAIEGQDMADIINDLLVAARADSGELVIHPRPIDLAEDIKVVVEHLPEVTARIELSPSSHRAIADPVRLRQIVRNLVVNAGRYGGSEVVIDLETDNGHVVVQVRDNGEGLPEDEWEAIFDPYRRSHHRQGQPASVGLGLTVSRMLARRMEGDLTYRYEDAHSVFELTLPAADQG